MWPGPGNPAAAGPGFGLSVLMVMVVMVMAVMGGCSKHRAGKHHQQKRCGENLFHG
jgi:hypothetical protein